MTSDPPPGNGTRWRLNDHDRRIEKLENANVSVLAERVRILDDEVRSLKRAFYTFVLGTLTAVIIFALTVGLGSGAQ